MPTRERILQLLDELERPIVDTEIAEMLEIEISQIHLLRETLEELIEGGYLIMTRKGKYGPPERFNFIRGRMQITQKGFGFLIPDQKDREDIFIPATATLGAMNGDEVLISITGKFVDGKRQEGRVERIVKRKNTRIVGNFELTNGFGFVVPDDPRIRRDIYVSKENAGGARSDQKVQVEIIRWPDGRRNPEGKVIEILGEKDDVGVDILSIIRQHQLRETFPGKVVKEAESVPTSIPKEEIDRREDLRSDLIVTIDGVDAKDLDDAISLKKNPQGNYVLGVHIADVSHYVREGSPLDKEAILRGTSVYLLDRVVPMLPEALSNGVCSLNPDADRLTLSVEMEINPQGAVVNHRIFESVIRSSYRLNYTEVSEYLENDVRTERLDRIRDRLLMMRELMQLLTKRREVKGAIDFDFAESYIILDDEGHPVDIERRERRTANRMIEEFMLITNEVVAEHYFWMEAPFLYRVHETPSPERIMEFNKIIHNFGYRLKGQPENLHPKAVQELIEEVKGTKEEHIINKLMLRSLKQARYSEAEQGHFGLAAEYYSHFTSPIRRYPDLQIHRIIKEDLAGKLGDNRRQHYAAILPEIARSSSEAEREAEKAERDVDDLKKAEFMQDKVGKVYTGMISSVTNFGFFVELENTVEGLIRMIDLSDDFYRYDESLMQLVGERKGRIYKIGDEVEIRVEKVSLDARTIDFDLA